MLATKDQLRKGCYFTAKFLKMVDILNCLIFLRYCAHIPLCCSFHTYKPVDMKQPMTSRSNSFTFFQTLSFLSMLNPLSMDHSYDITAIVVIMVSVCALIMACITKKCFFGLVTFFLSSLEC